MTAPDRATLMRRRAEAQALRLRRDLNLAANQPVDIFEVIRSLRLWLLFTPMSRVYGMYQHQTDSSGIAINVKVHPAMQRFTAAHEVGHYIMNHTGAVDMEENVTRFSGLGQQELAAQMFASELLMPLAAVNTALGSLHLDPAGIEATGAYQLSLRLGTSYTATVVRLETLQLIDRGRSQRLRKVQPQQLKRELVEDGLKDPRSDVWLVDRSTTELDLAPFVGDKIVVALREIPSSGFRWGADVAPGLEIEEDGLSLPQGMEKFGVTGERHIRFSVTEPMHAVIPLRLARPWSPREAVEEVAISVEARERPTPGLYAPQRTAILAR
jgi:Zn-dependent peptidase ImmA (M78 family)/predicted secreted protein